MAYTTTMMVTHRARDHTEANGRNSPKANNGPACQMTSDNAVTAMGDNVQPSSPKITATSNITMTVMRVATEAKGRISPNAMYGPTNHTNKLTNSNAKKARTARTMGDFIQSNILSSSYFFVFVASAAEFNTSIATRRFMARPATVSLDAKGSVSPTPTDTMREGSTPLSVNTWLTT